MGLIGPYLWPAVSIPGLVSPIQDTKTSLEFYQGDDFHHTFIVENADGPIDLTTGSATWVLNACPESIALLTKTLSAGLTQTEPGLVDLVLTTEDTEDLAPGIYHQALQITVDNQASTILQDVVVVKQKIIP